MDNGIWEYGIWMVDDEISLEPAPGGAKSIPKLSGRLTKI